MKTKLANENRLNQTKTDLINELLIKNEKNLNRTVECIGGCIGTGI